MKVQVYNKNLEPQGEMDLNPRIFEIQPVMELVQQAVHVQRANARHAIAHTKTKGEVSGGGKKPWKQKGTGNARAGSTRSPIWRHGGITFGPRSNRNYELKMNKKEWRKALFMTLTDKAQNNGLLLFSEMSLEQPKTKEMSAFIKSVSDKVAKDAKKFLVVIPKNDENVVRATKNLKNAKVVNANSLNVMDILAADAVLAPKESVAVIEKTYLK